MTSFCANDERSYGKNGKRTSILNSYEKQKQLYDDIKNKTAQVIAIQEYIYQQLKMSIQRLLKAKN